MIVNYVDCSNNQTKYFSSEAVGLRGEKIRYRNVKLRKKIKNTYILAVFPFNGIHAYIKSIR